MGTRVFVLVERLIIHYISRVPDYLPLIMIIREKQLNNKVIYDFL